LFFATSRLVALVERVGPMPKQGLSSTFKFGCGVGLTKASLAAP